MPTSCMDDFEAEVNDALVDLDNDLAACESGATPTIRSECRQQKLTAFNDRISAASAAFANCKKNSGSHPGDPDCYPPGEPQ